MWKRGEVDWDGKPLVTQAKATEQRMVAALDKAQPSRVAVHLRLDTLSSLFNIVTLLGNARRAIEQPANSSSTASSDGNPDSSEDNPRAPPMPAARPLEVHGIRLLELTDRTSSVMQSAELDDLADQDAVFSAFQTFSQLNGVAVAGHVAVVPTSRYAETLVEHAKEARTDLMFVPWSTHGSLTEDNNRSIADAIPVTDRLLSRQHIDFVQSALAKSSCTTGVYISPSHEDLSRSKQPAQLRRTRTGISVQSGRDGQAIMPKPGSKSQHVFMPFIGGNDDQAALLFVLQLANNPQVTVTIAHMRFPSDGVVEVSTSAVGGGPVAEKSGTAKDAILEPSASDLELLATARQTLKNTTIEKRVTFIDVDNDTAAVIPERAIELFSETFKAASAPRSSDDIVVVGRKHACLASLLSKDTGLERDLQKTIGVLGDVVARSGSRTGLLVMSARENEEEPNIEYWG